MAQSPTPPAAVKLPQQPDQLSNSSSQGTKAPTLSTLSAPDDLDGSDSLPEYHTNYIASSNHQHVGYKGGQQQQQQQPDVVHSHGGESGLEPGWHGYGHSMHLYTVTSDPYYRRFMASGDLQDGHYRHYGSPSHTE